MYHVFMEQLPLHILIHSQIVLQIGAKHIYLVNGTHGAVTGPAHSYDICTLEDLYIMKAAAFYGIYPRINELTAVSMDGKLSCQILIILIRERCFVL